MTGNVSWKEGLALSPQHLQRLWASFREDLNQHPGHPPSRGFGLSQLDLDEVALETGTIVVRQAAGVFPGGIRFDTAQVPLPRLSRTLPSDWAANEGKIGVSIALPTPSETTGNVGAGSTFVEFSRPLADTVQGKTRRDVDLLAPNLSLHLSTQSPDGYILLPLFEIERGRQGQPVVAEDSLPILLDIGAWPPLMERIAKLSELAGSRCQEMEDRNPAIDAQGLRRWLEHLHLRTHIPALERALKSPGTHPADLHADLLRLAGGISFTTGTRAPDSRYDHSNPKKSILALVEWLFHALSTQASSDHLVQAMNREAPMLFSLQLPRETWISGRKFHLAIRSKLALEQLAQLFAQHAKTAPRSRLQAIIMSALPGIEVRVSAPPAFFRATGQICFEINTENPLWQALLEEGFLGIYSPANLEISSIELLVEGN
jgi:type VI secretion system ImpJ/VasE family protein